MLILALVVAGEAGLFVVGKRHILHSRCKMTAGELGKYFLDPLQMQVRQDTWGTASNSLTIGVRYCDSDGGHTQQPSGCPSLGERTLDYITYNAQYTIDNISVGTSNLRRVRADISWLETTP